MSDAFVLEQRSSTDLVVGRMLNDVGAVISVSAAIVTPVRFPGETTSMPYTSVIAPDSTEDSVVYSSSNTAIATVDSSGNITAVSIGSCTISVEVFGSGAQVNSNSVVVSDTLHVLVAESFAPEQRSSTDLIVDFMYQDGTIGGGGVYPTSWTSSAFGSPIITVTASFTPTGWSSSAFGTALVFNKNWYVLPDGVASSNAFGTAWVSNWHQFVIYAGWKSSAFGTALVYNSDQIVVNGGWRSSEFGTPTAFDPLQTITVAGIEAPAFPVTHYVADYYQYIDVTGHAPGDGQLGAPLVAFRVRTVEVPFIYTNAFGTPEVESFLNIPDSWVSSVVSTGAMVSLAVREIAHWASTPTSVVSRPTVYHRNRFLAQGGWASLEIPAPTVFNLTQYVTEPVHYVNSPPQFVGTPAVKNRNRVVAPSGFHRGLFGRRTDTFVTNGARAVAPAGIDSLVWGEDTFIAHRIRYVLPDSWDDLRMRRWAVVYNDAFLVSPPSIGDTSQFGRPDPVLNLRRTVKQFNVSDQSVFGTAFVAPRVRYVYPRGIVPLHAGFPVVRLNPQPVAPAGIAPLPFGHVVLYRFQRIAQPMSFNVFAYTRVGEPWVRNRNQVVRPQPVVRGEYGRATVANRDQYVLPAGIASFALGACSISFRTRQVLLGGIPAPAISLIHRVRNSIADPPGAQVVYPLSIYVGIASSVGIVPSPVARHPTIYPDGWDSLSFGTSVVRSTSIAPRSIVDLDRFGTPVFSSTQYVFCAGIFEWEFAVQVQRPRLSPHTIYAPAGDQATTQARANNPASAPPHVIGLPGGDGLWSLDGGWPWFGRPDVSTSPRSVTPFDVNPSYPQWGMAAVDLRLRYVRPFSIRGPRFGPVTIGNVPQYVGFNDDMPGYDAVGAVGAHVVAFPPSPYVRPSGLDASSFGSATVELLNREIAPEGIPHRGNPQQGLINPWGVAVVGYPRTYQLSVGDSTLWGTHVIEYLHRQVFPTGWDSLSLVTESLGSFDDRMRVERVELPHPVPSIPPTTGVGTPTVSFYVREVAVQPIRPPRLGLARIGMTVAPSGWVDEVFGDIDQWEEGTIKPHGDEMMVFPAPRLARGVTLTIGDSSDVGVPRMARAVYVAGMPPVGFAGPSVTDEFGCSRRVVTVWPIQAPSFPQPVVTQ